MVLHYVDRQAHAVFPLLADVVAEDGHHTHTDRLMTDLVTAVRRRMLTSIGVNLEEPYFIVENRWMKMGAVRCMHDNMGVRLDEVDRRCYCRGCNLQLDPFEALLYYANAERRLVGHVETLKRAERDEIKRKEIAKTRQPFIRAVTSYTAVKDLTLKAEPIIGYTLHLECGHCSECGPTRKPKRVTCRICAKSQP